MVYYMKVVALVCSARRRGNCYDLAELMLSHLRMRGVKTKLINAYDHKITPCSHCNYECFQAPRSCPIQDDVPRIWEQLKDADGIILALPAYYGMPPSIFQAIIERAQGILDWVTKEFRDIESVWGGKPIALVVVSDGGGEAVRGTIIRYLPPSAKVITEVFSYSERGAEYYLGGMIEDERIAARAKRLADTVYNLLRERSATGTINK